jgi:hypothetical protein
MNKSVSSTLLLATFVSLAFCFIDTQIQAQNDTTYYIFPELVQGSVKMKDGRTEVAMMNYNKITEEMIFEKDGVKLALDSLQTIDTVYIESRVFVPHLKVFYELLVKGKVSLFVQNKCNLIDSGDPSGYGGKTETGAVRNLSSVTNSVHTYRFKLPNDYYVTDATFFCITINNKFYKANSVSQIMKVFPENSKSIKLFIRQNKLDLKNTNDLITLIVRCSEFVR